MSKITDIKVKVVEVSPKTKWSFVEVLLADGMTGIGEATVYGKDIELVDFAARLKPQLVQLDEDELPQFCAQTRGLGLIGQAIVSAVEQASWDIRGKREGRPACALLGKLCRTTIPTYANINRRCTDRTVQGFFDNAADAVQQGFDAVKIAPFDGLEPDMGSEGEALFNLGLDRIKATRDAVGPGVDLMVDCHWRLSHDRATRLFFHAAELGLFWVECPVPENPDDVSNLAALKPAKQDSGIRLAGAERGTDTAYFEALMSAGLYDVIMPDIKYAGGLSGLMAIAELAGERGVDYAPHNPSGPLGHIASLNLVACVPNLLSLEHQLGESPLFFDLCPNAVPEIREGKSDLPDGPGLSFQL